MKVPEVEAAVRILNPPGVKALFTTGEKRKDAKPDPI